MFGDFGVAHQIEIADEEDLALFIAGIDVLLVPFRDAQLEKMASALIQGVPAVVLDYTGRILTPLLDAAGFSARMLAAHEDEYVAKAIDLSGDKDFRKLLAGKAKETLLSCPVFDAQKLAGNLAEAFKSMLAHSK